MTTQKMSGMITKMISKDEWDDYEDEWDDYEDDFGSIVLQGNPCL